MPKLLLVLACAVLSCAAQAPDPVIVTGGYSNGRLWKILDPDTKVFFIEAYHDGYLFATGVICSGVKRDEEKVGFPLALTKGEIRAALDQFYDVPENGPIPVMHAMQIVALKAIGTPQSAIDKHLADVRRVATQDSHKR